MPWACRQRQFSLKKEQGSKDQCYQSQFRMSTEVHLCFGRTLCRGGRIRCNSRTSQMLQIYCRLHWPTRILNAFMDLSGLPPSIRPCLGQASSALPALFITGFTGLAAGQIQRRAVEKGICTVEIWLQPSKCPTRSQS